MADKRIKIAQIGVCHEHASGKISSLKKLTEDFEIVGYVDDNEFSVSPKFSGSDLSFYAELKRLSLDEALNYTGLQAVTVEVPNNELVPMGLRCAEHNLAMHMDKPGGEDIALYGKLLEECRRRDLPFQMGFMFRQNPAFKFCREAIISGMLGDVFDIELDMNHNYGGEPYNQYIGKFKGGIMYNLGCHLIDFVVSAMGAPEHVVSFLQSTGDQPTTVKNNCLAVLEYPHSTASLRACCSMPNADALNMRRMLVVGTNGSIEFSPLERFDGKPIEISLSLKTAVGGFPSGEHVIRFAPQRDRYKDQLLEFAGIIRGEIKNPYSYEHDHLVNRVVMAAGGYINWEKNNPDSVYCVRN